MKLFGIITATALTLFSLTAQAAEAPKSVIDMTKPLLDELGRPVVDPTQNKNPIGDPQCAQCTAHITIGLTITRALCAKTADDEKDPGQAWARCALGERLREDPGAVLTPTEIVRIKSSVGQSMPPAVIMQVFPLVDPSTPAPDLK